MMNKKAKDRPILVITNRRFNGDKTIEGGVYSDKEFMSLPNRKGVDELRVAKAESNSEDGKRWTLEILPELPDRADIDDFMGAKALRERLQYYQESENYEPRDVVVFVHGFFQSLEYNLRKARRIQNQYDVDVIAYSWPASPFFAKYLSIVMAVLWGGLISMIYLPDHYNAPLTSSMAFWAVTGAMLFFLGLVWIAQYIWIKTYAKQSAAGLEKMLVAMSKGRAPETKSPYTMNLLVHSLGHKVFQSYLESTRESNRLGIFRNIICHQADTEHKGHENWLRFVPINVQVDVTHNKFDKVLLVSWLGNFGKPRLGLGWLAMRLESARYTDLTAKNNVGWCHDIFHDDEALQTPDIERYLLPLLKGRRLITPVDSADKVYKKTWVRTTVKALWLVAACWAATSLFLMSVPSSLNVHVFVALSWALLPPAFFVWEYFQLDIGRISDSALADFRHKQVLAGRLWLGVAAALAVLFSIN